MKRSNPTKWRLACGAALAALSLASAAQAQVRRFNLPPQPAVTAIPEFARQAGLQIIAPAGQLAGVVTPEVRGELDAREALRRLIAPTGLEVASDTGTVITLRRKAAAPAGSDAANTNLSELVVTGSRIRGVAPSSPLMDFSDRDITEGGFGNVGELIRSIPQNFNGGQNPGLIAGSSGRNSANQNITGGSALNLRGLGPDATLTLINGRRLSYDGLAQAVDISFIPLAAIDRLQIVADGASAIYGSDAVGGVANVFLKRDFEGVAASARYGGATDGGDVTTQASLTVGDRWARGGILASAQYDHNTVLDTADREFSRSMLDTNLLLPEARQWSAVITGHHDLTENLEVVFDALGSDRRVLNQLTYPTSRYDNQLTTKSYALAPAVRLRAPADWTVDLSAVLAANQTRYAFVTYSPAGALIATNLGCYCNSARQYELTAEGPLFQLPGGEARAAVGGGHRRNRFASGSTRGELSSRYVYAEVNAPLLSTEGGQRLSVTAAVRHESYETLGEVTTPKIGLLYSPFEDLQFRASWGESFKAPTLLQQNLIRYIAVFRAQFFDPGAAVDQQVLVIGGGGSDLVPETAETLTVGFTYQPHFVRGLRVDANYFEIDYLDRVVEPISDFSLAFRDAAYADYVVRNPTGAQMDAERARASLFYSLTGPFNPARVIGIVDNSLQNAARQGVRGVDLDVRYTMALGDGELAAQATGSWLRLTQQNSATGPTRTLTGTVFNPAEFRARAGLIWRSGGLTVTGFVNHVQGMKDVGLVPPADVEGQQTFDLTTLYRFTAPGPLHNLELGLTVLNLTNAQPPRVRGTVDYVPQFDSTNYSAVGRFVSISATKRW